MVATSIFCVALMLLTSLVPDARVSETGGSGGGAATPSSSLVLAASSSDGVTTTNVGSSPEFAAVDSQNGWVYVANYGGSTVSVLNGTGGTASVTSVTVGSEPLWVTYDSANHDVYVANYKSNSVSVISGTKVVATLSIGSEPLLAAYDPANGYIYVPDSGTTQVTVINGTTNTVQGTVTVASAPHSVTVDPANGYVYVPQWSGGVSVINGLTLVKDVTVGTEPLNAVYDSGNGYVYVTNSYSNTVSVLSGTTVLATLSVGSTPNAVLYDPVNGYVYVSNAGGTTVSVVSGTSVLSSVTVGSEPLFSAYNPVNGVVYGPISGGSTVAVLNGTTLETPIAVGSAPHDAVYDGPTGQIYVVNTGSDNVSLIPVMTLVASEQDLSYDSITQTGGGISIGWSYPPLAWPWPVSEIFVTVWNSTQTILTPLAPATTGSNGWSGAVNLSLALGSGQRYDFSVTINDTKTNLSSSVDSFVYHQDTSKDGLTDAEKRAGWTVPLASGAEKVTANATLFSTNGLANDYLEDEYSLNPNTLDSADSDMLDLWNLTFDLGANSTNPAVPDSKDFHLWWETNSSYDPFEGAPVPDDPSWGHAPLATGSGGTGLSNISCTLQSCAGNSSYSAGVLWSRQALSTFLNMSGTLAATSNGEWLRGIVATYDGQRTLTLWGKLSWGANPYAVSTPNDGIPDGARVNPVYSAGLELDFGNGFVLNPNGTSKGCGNIPEGGAIAGYFSVPDALNDGHSGIQGYTAQANNPSSGCGSFADIGYVLTTPVNNTLQFQPVTIGFVANISTNSAPDTESLPVNGCHDEVNLSIDMLDPPPVLYTLGGVGVTNMYWGNGNGQCQQAGSASTLITLGVSEVNVGEKSPTYVWVPDTNSTLGPGPIGIRQYTGEQSFVNIVVADGASGSPWGSQDPTSPIPYPDAPNASYTVTFDPGLTNLLMPRSAFLSSDFGQALVGSYLGYSGATAPPLLSPNETSLPTFGATDPLESLACYWQNRSVAASGTTDICESEKGTPAATLPVVSVDAAPNATASNRGGLPTDPGFENASTAGAAIQAVVTLNLSSWSDANLILASLLDNTTGGVNGSFVLMTSELASLGLVSAVMTALANATYPSGGVFGLPVSQATPPSPPTNWWSATWNTVSGIGSVIVKGVATLVGVSWSVASAALDFIDYVGAGLAHLGAQVVSRTTTALKTVGEALEKALQALLTFLTDLVERALAVVVDPIVSAAKSFDSALGAATNATVADVSGGGSVTTAHAEAWASAFTPIATISVAFGVAVTAALALLAPFELGANFFVPLLMGLIGTLASYLVPGFSSGISQLSAEGVTDLQDGLPINSIPSVVFEALAESTAIDVSLTDLFFVMAKAVSLGLTVDVANALVDSLMIDLVVFVVSIIAWASHFAPIVLAALFFSLVGLAIAINASKTSRTVPGLDLFGEVTSILAVIGAGAAGADLALVEGWI